MTGFLRTFSASAVLQLRILRGSPFELFVLLTVPLQTAGFLAIFRYAGRRDLDFYALIAPALIALWQLALLISGRSSPVNGTTNHSNRSAPRPLPSAMYCSDARPWSHYSRCWHSSSPC